MKRHIGRVIPPYSDPKHALSAITLEHVTVSYNGRPALDEVTATFCCGERVAIVGPNGAGKSTLFKAITGLLPIDAGHICLHGEQPDARSRLAYVPQREAIDWSFPVTVADVVMMGRYGRLGWFRQPGRHDRAIVARSLERVGMADYSQVQIGELSGGQQQRVFLARAVAQEADLLLLDEPFNAVDLATQQATFELLDELQREGKTVITATHDLATVAEHFDRVLVLNRRVIAFGPAAEVFTPQVLTEAYGGQLAMIPANGDMLIGISDAHGV
jgi:ABC-type Mn2+/Zn2+ transport system ATPase subunit